MQLALVEKLLKGNDLCMLSTFCMLSLCVIHLHICSVFIMVT